MKEVVRVAAFADGPEGGNPAGVVICDELPSADAMQAIAAEVGYSETAFAAPSGAGWRVRYFAPEVEVAFCGHATIALGATLAERHGNGVLSFSSTVPTSPLKGAATDRRCLPLSNHRPHTAGWPRHSWSLMPWTCSPLREANWIKGCRQ